MDAAAPAEVQASGGVRSPADAVRLLEAGAARVVVGTAALAGAAELESFVAALGERLVVAIDVRDRRVAARGWLDDTGLEPAHAARRCAEAGVKRVLCTAIERDGMLAGPDLELLREVREAWGLPVLALVLGAGGIGLAIRRGSRTPRLAATADDIALVDREREHPDEGDPQ